ncbi:carbohydrate ABC transporter permease [Paenibacillus macerans]|uniref:carbohydrate ABC transporter permease n=1 Tax=Paenibacillus macerans TaxID=44252 RepID=UPI0022E98FDB|nr:carbohydrate ABC transporter permease [Paenibacillus macerans]
MSQAARRWYAISFHFLMTILGILMIYPLIWSVASSFKDNSEIFVNSYSLFPRDWGVIENYLSGWKGVGGVSFGRFLWNSAVVAVIGTLGGVMSSLMAAYAFARVRFALSSFWFVCVMTTLMIPNQVMIVPQYILFKRLHLIDTLTSLIIPWFFGSAFFIFLMVQFIRGLPLDLDEAVEIDGCGKMGIFFRIVLPLATPAIITSTIFSFYWIWQDFFQPLIFISSTRMFTVSLALNLYFDPNSFSNYGGLFAMSVISLIPVVAVFLVFQRYLVEGVATTGLKG